MFMNKYSAHQGPIRIHQVDLKTLKLPDCGYDQIRIHISVDHLSSFNNKKCLQKVSGCVRDEAKNSNASQMQRVRYQSIICFPGISKKVVWKDVNVNIDSP